MTKRPDTQSIPPTLPETSEQADNRALPKLTLEPDRYREHLSAFELSTQQQNEMMQILWNIMSTMVDIGWGVDTVQLFLPELFEKTGPDSGNLLQQTHTPPMNTQAINAAKTKDSADEQ